LLEIIRAIYDLVSGCCGEEEERKYFNKDGVQESSDYAKSDFAKGKNSAKIAPSNKSMFNRNNNPNDKKKFVKVKKFAGKDQFETVEKMGKKKEDQIEINNMDGAKSEKSIGSFKSKSDLDLEASNRSIPKQFDFLKSSRRDILEKEEN